MKSFGGPVDVIPQPLLVLAGREAAERQSKMPIKQVVGDIPSSAKWFSWSSKGLAQQILVEVALPAFALMSCHELDNEFLARHTSRFSFWTIVLTRMTTGSHIPMMISIGELVFILTMFSA